MKGECRICGNRKDATAYRFADYHLKNGETFDYFMCNGCGCLQSADPFRDHGAYYPDDYYSFSGDDETSLTSKVKWLLRRVRNNYYRTGKGVAGRLIHTVLPNTAISLFHTLHPKPEWAILDIGCGNEALFLRHLAENGYRSLLGVDPYLPVPSRKIGSAEIIREELSTIRGTFDCITFHHSFEHIPDQLGTLRKGASLLSDDGTILIRIPTVDSDAWKTQKEFWGNLDAPRHLFLHSRKSIGILAEKCGLSIDSVVYDSNGFQFWGAALYRKGIPLGGNVSKQIALQRLFYRLYYSIRMVRRIAVLNRQSRGDTMAVFMRKAV
jgi:SAM-dependent methyltransferase